MVARARAKTALCGRAMLGLRDGRIWARALLLAVACWIFPHAAQAYPWLIRHHYPSCAACHVDPSGGGLPTAYGHYVGSAVLPTLPSTDETPAATDAKATGPAWLQVGGDYR